MTKIPKFPAESDKSIDVARKPIWRGSPPLVRGESLAEYNDLLARVMDDVRPDDIFEEIWMYDVVNLTWEVLRWRRIKTSLVEAGMFAAEVCVLAALPHKRLAHLGVSRDPKFVVDKAELPIFREPSSEPRPRKRSSWDRSIAKKLASGDVSAAQEEILAQANELIAERKTMKDTTIARAHLEELDYIERIDRLIMITEGRRNAIMREIDRHRASAARALRTNISNIEQAELKDRNGRNEKSYQ